LESLSAFLPLKALRAFLLAAFNAASTIPAALLGPLKSSGLLSSPKILIVGKPRTPYLPPRDLCSSAFTAPTFTMPYRNNK